MRLNGKTALVTGGSSGIGLAVARLFVDEGARVIVLARHRERLDAALASLGPMATGIQADVARPDALAVAMREVGEHVDGLDVVFANAGVSDAPPFGQTTEADFDALIGINLKGVFFTVVNALPLLRDGASVILCGSVAAGKGRPGDPLYAASKGAVRSFGRTLAMDDALLERGIRVNVVTPGATITPLTRQATDDPVVRDHVSGMVPMGRWGTAQEVAQAVLFLASEASSYTTGAEITVDGGLAHV